ncbi:MAG: radical SAM protein [Anaerolineae bacterium]|nr:radical SAM protein [Anaerolineae bacterium]
MPEPEYWQAEILIATTWDCNLRCTYCFVQENELAEVTAHMTPELATRVVDALDEGLSHVKTICLHLYGGEPLTNLPAMEAMVNRAQEKAPGRFTFAITTNGTVLSQKVIDLLNAGRFEIILSIDGPAEIHDACRRTRAGDPTHERVMQFLSTVRSRTKSWVRGSSVIRSGWSLAQAVEYLNTLPIHTIKAQAVRAANGSPLALSSAERRAYMEDLEAIGQQVIADMAARRMPKDDRFSSRVLQLFKGAPREFFCAAGKTTFGITPSGDVLSCVLLDAKAHRLGHIDDDPETWIEAGKEWRASRVRRPECAECDEVFLCGGGCPAMLSVCATTECEVTRKECQIARSIFEHFQGDDDAILMLAGIT